MAKKTKKAKVKVGIKEPQVVNTTAEKKTPPGKPPKRIRMLISCANQYRAFNAGAILLVPQEVPVKTARSWLESGIAEQDKSLPDPPETK